MIWQFYDILKYNIPVAFVVEVRMPIGFVCVCLQLSPFLLQLLSSLWIFTLLARALGREASQAAVLVGLGLPRGHGQVCQDSKALVCSSLQLDCCCCVEATTSSPRGSAHDSCKVNENAYCLSKRTWLIIIYKDTEIEIYLFLACCLFWRENCYIDYFSGFSRENLLLF